MEKRGILLIFIMLSTGLFFIDVNATNILYPTNSSCTEYEGQMYDECLVETEHYKVIETASKENNPKLCFDTYSSGECVAEVAIANKDIFACDIFNKTNFGDPDVQSKSTCVSAVALFYNNISLCSEGIGSKEICLAKVSIFTSDVNLCESVTDSLWKDICIFDLSTKKADITLCTKLHNEEQRSDCYNGFLYGGYVPDLQFSPELCNKIDLEQPRESCFGTLKSLKLRQLTLQYSPYLFYLFSFITLVLITGLIFFKQQKRQFFLAALATAFLAIFFRFISVTPPVEYYEIQINWPHYLVLWGFVLVSYLFLFLEFKNLLEIKEKSQLRRNLIKNYVLVMVLILLVHLLSGSYAAGVDSLSQLFGEEGLESLIIFHIKLLETGFFGPTGSWQFLFWGIVSYHYVTKLKKRSRFKATKVIKYAKIVSISLIVLGILSFLFTLMVGGAIAAIG